jgi:hypothetical protein
MNHTYYYINIVVKNVAKHAFLRRGMGSETPCSESPGSDKEFWDMTPAKLS